MIADRALREAISKSVFASSQIPIVSDADPRLLATQLFRASELAEITSLDLSASAVEDLWGAEFLINLTSLNLAHTGTASLLPLELGRFTGVDIHASSDFFGSDTLREASIDLVGTARGPRGLEHLSVDFAGPLQVESLEVLGLMHELRTLTLDELTLDRRDSAFGDRGVTVTDISSTFEFPRAVIRPNLD